MLNNQLIKQFEETIIATTRHDNHIEHIVGVLIKQVLASRKCTRQNIVGIQEFYGFVMDEINSYIRQYDKLCGYIETNLTIAEKLSKGKCRSSAKTIKSLRDLQF